MNSIVIFILVFFLSAFSAFAQTKTPSPSPTIAKKEPSKSPTEKSIETLKEKIADKVDELRSQSKQVTAGTIGSIKGNSVELVTDDSKTFSISTEDGLTKIYDIIKNKKKEIEYSSLKKGDYIIVSGPTVESAITANEIYRDTPYIVTSGQITGLDKDEFTIDVVTTDKEEMTLDIETETKQQIIDVKSLEPSKTGFSKLKNGDTIHFVAFKKDIKSQTYSALRILVIPQEFF